MRRKKKAEDKPIGAVHRCKRCNRRHGSKEPCTVNVVVPTPTIAIDPKAKKGDRSRWHGMMKDLGLEKFRIGKEDVYISPNREYRRAVHGIRRRRPDGSSFTKPPRRIADRRPLHLQPTTLPGPSRKRVA